MAWYIIQHTEHFFFAHTYLMPVTLRCKIIKFLVKYWKLYEFWNFAVVFSFPTTFDGTTNFMDNLKTNFYAYLASCYVQLLKSLGPQ